MHNKKNTQNKELKFLSKYIIHISLHTVRLILKRLFLQWIKLTELLGSLTLITSILLKMYVLD